MSSRLRGTVAGLMVLVAALALAGCVSIPSSSGVNQGPLVAKGGDQAPHDIPLGPPHNASKTELVNDFLLAATSAEGNYEIARRFLTAKAAKSWSPTKSVLVREKPATPENVGDDVVDYSVSTKASVNALGVYVEQGRAATQTLSYDLVKVNGQWRISDLPDGIVLSRNNFETSFGSFPVYFFDPDYRYLVPDVRWFPVGSTATDRIVSALLAGPSALLQGGVVATAFPAGVIPGSPVVVHNSTAVVDFSANSATTKGVVRGRMHQQLEQSLLPASITSVTMSARGAPLAFPDAQDSHAIIAAPNPTSPLLQKGKQFGFYPGLQSLGNISTQIAALGGTAASVSRDRAVAGVLAKGSVYVVTGAGARQVDSRAGLLPPTIDPFGYVWSVPADGGSAIHVVGVDGVVHQLASPVPADATLVSLTVSHDGTRVLAYLSTAAGPRLLVAGVIRRAGLPASLGDPLDLPVSSATPIDATWVDPATVAALGSDESGNVVTTYVIGGSPGDTSRTEGAIRLVGTGIDSLRVLTDAGEVQQLRASGWQNIGVTATILATQQ